MQRYLTFFLKIPKKRQLRAEIFDILFEDTKVRGSFVQSLGACSRSHYKPDHISGGMKSDHNDGA